MYLLTSALKQVKFLFSSYVLAIFKIFLAQYSQFTDNSYIYIVFANIGLFLPAVYLSEVIYRL